MRGPAQNTLSDVMAIVTFQSAWHTMLAVVHLFSAKIKTTVDIQLVTLVVRAVCFPQIRAETDAGFSRQNVKVDGKESASY